MIQAKTVFEKFHLKPAEAVFSTVFFRYNFRPEVDNDVIFGVDVYHVCVDVRVKFADSRLNGFKDIREAYFLSNERTRRSLSA